MRVAIIGAGLNGVCSALELTLRGHAVEVFERRSGIATEASFAAPGVMHPFALPGLRPGSWWPRLGEGATWHWQQRQARRAPAWLERQRLLVQLGRQSRDWLRQVGDRFPLEYEQRQGWLLLLRDERCARAAEADLALLTALDLRHQRLDATAARALEPALPDGLPAAGAVHLPDVPVVNARQLAQQLRLAAQDAGARFHLNADVLALQPGQPLRLQWQARPAQADYAGGPTPASGSAVAEAAFDAVVLCTGGADGLLPALGLKLPLRVVSGCSLTAPLVLPEAMPDPGPRSAVTDRRTGMTITRLGQRVRITDPWTRAKGQPDAATQSRMYQVLEHWFPGAGRGSQVQAWLGQRPCLPDDAPALGATPVPGVWLNLGHAEQGGALAGGCAQTLADLVEGRAAADPAVALLSPTRWA